MDGTQPAVQIPLHLCDAPVKSMLEALHLILKCLIRRKHLVDLLHIHYMIAKLIAAGIVMLWNYVLKRRAVLGKT